MARRQFSDTTLLNFMQNTGARTHRLPDGVGWIAAVEHLAVIGVSVREGLENLLALYNEEKRLNKETTSE